MTSDYIASKLSLLPQFMIDDIDHGPEKYGRGKQMLGRFSELPQSESQSATFFLPDLRSIRGILHAAPEGQCIRLFQQHDNWPTDISDAELLSGTLAYCGNSAKQHVELALDQSISWTEQTFLPKRSLQLLLEDADGKPVRIEREYIEGESMPEGATIVDSGWNHVHCSFCNEGIGPGEIGFVGDHANARNDWVCPWCYINSVEPHDLRPLLIPKGDRVSV